LASVALRHFDFFKPRNQATEEVKIPWFQLKGVSPMAASGSPITVDGGGSVKIKFKHSAYDQPGGGDDHNHTDKNTQVDRVEITRDGQTEVINIGGGKVRIEIHLITVP
jgi:hypothetical protein